MAQVEAEKNNQEAAYQAIFQLDVPNAKLWDTEHPNLYTCKAIFGEDEVTETFGIRELIWNCLLYTSYGNWKAVDIHSGFCRSCVGY